MTINKKITFLISSLKGGGTERVCVSVANSLADRGWQVDLVVLNIINEAYLNTLSDSINLITLNVNHTRYSSIPLLRYIYKKKPKTILVFNYELSVIIFILRFFFRFKFKIISRNTNTFSIKIKQFKNQGLWARYVVLPLINFFYQKIDHVVNQCNAMRKDLISVHPKLYKNSSVIKNPIPTYIENYTIENNLVDIKKEDYLLCVGRLEKQKAFHYAIEAFAGIIKKNQNLRLKIVGQGNLEKDLKQKTIDCGVSSKVDFEGFQKNIIPYYLYAKGTILTSLYEGYPNVLIESIALNTPVIAFDCPSGPNEIIQEGLNGYLVKYCDINDLKKKLLILLSNKINISNLKYSIEKNKIRTIAKKYEDLINKFN